MGQTADFDARIAQVPAGPVFRGKDHYAPLRAALQRHGQFGPNQMAGRLFPIACVALEVTQRCNLDCTACYLSEAAELAKDPPLAELIRRVAMVASHYGPQTTIQITGGDPTLRPADDLEALVRAIRAAGLRSALFTNGIRASRPLLRRLTEAGLDDVAFHVDLTQERKGYASEAALNAVREDYLGRVAGLGLKVHFNTTLFAGNLAELPDLVRFFKRHAGAVAIASFQLQAETGRGTLGARDAVRLTPDRIAETVNDALGAALPFGYPQVGHSDCNSYAAALVAGEAVAPLYGDRDFFDRLLPAIADLPKRPDWNRDDAMWRGALRLVLRRPGLAWRGLRYLARTAWHLAPGLLRARRPRRLSFFIHNFMDAGALDQARCESCVFMAMTANGPLSMCVHNAERDRHLFAGAAPKHASIKTMKGRARAAVLAAKEAPRCDS